MLTMLYCNNHVIIVNNTVSCVFLTDLSRGRYPDKHAATAEVTVFIPGAPHQQDVVLFLTFNL